MATQWGVMWLWPLSTHEFVIWTLAALAVIKVYLFLFPVMWIWRTWRTTGESPLRVVGWIDARIPRPVLYGLTASSGTRVVPRQHDLSLGSFNTEDCDLHAGVWVHQQGQQPSLWYQPFYRVRKKVVALTGKYWIEDQRGNTLGFKKQKLLPLKEDIRIYTDKKMKHELFFIKQAQVVDTWGTFAVVDTASNICVGNLKRQMKSAITIDEWHICDPWGRPYGRVFEGTGKGLMRKYVPGGSLVPETVSLGIGGQVCAEIMQRFKIVGDIWEVDCSSVPPDLDRRVLLAAILMLALVERKKK